MEKRYATTPDSSQLQSGSHAANGEYSQKFG